MASTSDKPLIFKPRVTIACPTQVEAQLVLEIFWKALGRRSMSAYLDIYAGGKLYDQLGYPLRRDNDGTEE